VKQALASLAVFAAFVAPALAQTPADPALADKRILADATLDGRQGAAKPDTRTPILVQPIVLNRTIEVLEETGVKWTVFDTEKIKAGAVLYGVGPVWCTHWLVCLADEDKDGTLEMGFVQINRYNDVLIFSMPQKQLGPVKTPAHYRPVPAPESYRHEIGVMVDRLTETKGSLKAKVTVRVRRAPGQWIVLGGPGYEVTLDAEGKGVFEAMGARIDLQAKDKRGFTYTIVRSMPEQAIEGMQLVQ
jgi:hypothetical protein